MKVCVFGVPRSGTTLTHRLVAVYLERKYGNPSTLGEVFNHLTYFRGNFEDRDGTLEQRFDGYTPGMPMLDAPAETLRRIDLLSTHRDRDYTIKLLSDGRCADGFDFINGRYAFILVKRRNVLDLVLSLGIAMHTNAWVLMAKPSQVPSSFTYTRENYDAICCNLRLFDEWSKACRNVIGTVTYEDYAKLMTPAEILQDIFPDWRSIMGAEASYRERLPVKPFDEVTKRSLISNYAEVRDWCAADFGARA